ncbi:hypothetical protein KIW84_045253 [Lathyrus oleraceus]|uniref:Uncharacterized protein n=1 Tax=Pisum sativum TaxID=3888 RepID=A0A9D4XI52_PEA|nr:hypothetical protein KIW84_045253 [Pisum sativum]
MHDGCWKPIDSGEGSDAPLASLDVRGIKEPHLHMMLQRIEISFKESIRRNVQNEVKRQNGDTVEKLKIEVVEIATDQDCGIDIYCPTSVLGRKLQLPCPSKFVPANSVSTNLPEEIQLETRGNAGKTPLSSTEVGGCSWFLPNELLRKYASTNLSAEVNTDERLESIALCDCDLRSKRNRTSRLSPPKSAPLTILVYQLKAYRCRMRFAWQQLALDFDLHSSYAPSFAVAADVTLIDLHADVLLHSLLVDEIVAASFQTAETI